MLTATGHRFSPVPYDGSGPSRIDDFLFGGGRYLRTKAVLGDAAEAAALMVSAAEYQSIDQSRQLAGAGFVPMVSDSNSLTARVKSLPCHDNPDCSGKTRDRTFVEHQLMVISAHDSWFAKGQAPTFAKEQHLQHKAISRKYVQGQAVDVLFVADFSGSMRGRWMGERKIAMLKRTLGKLALTIESQTAGVVDPHYKNTVALIPFGSTTQELTQDNQICSTSQTQHENVQWGIDHLFAVKECESRIRLPKPSILMPGLITLSRQHVMPKNSEAPWDLWGRGEELHLMRVLFGLPRSR